MGYVKPANTSIEALTSRRLSLDGTSFSLSIDPHDAEYVYLPLARRIAHDATRLASRRYLCGLAGPPGAGKSASATILAAAIDAVAPELHATVIPLDGFHYSNRYLESTDDDIPHRGRVNLRTIKGHWATFDATRLLRELRLVAEGVSIRLPTYSRELHEPVEDSLSITSECRVAIVEGNYLYLDREPWASIRDLFDERLFIVAPRSVLESQLTERHMRGGRTKDEAIRQIQAVDIPNMEEVFATAHHANTVIRGARGELTLTHR